MRATVLYVKPAGDALRGAEAETQIARIAWITQIARIAQIMRIVADPGEMAPALPCGEVG
jgi:hypothetical protein